jgi:hypothetical protein
MANSFLQAVTQTTTASQSYERVIVQYISDTNIQDQVMVNYDTLSASEKTTYDNYVALCKSKMPT